MKKLVFSLVLFGFSCFASAKACTDFVIKTKDDATINGRSLEFGLDLKSKILIRPRGQQRVSESSDYYKNMTWFSKYASIAVNALDLDHAIDGFNEKGLSVGILWQPDSEYPVVKPNQDLEVLNLISIGDYLLDNFQSVEEVKEGLKDLKVVAQKVNALGMIPPIHVALHDITGRSAVIEFIDGQMIFSDNFAGVLTNAPRLEWHLTNLRNYLDVSSRTTDDVKISSTVLSPVGQGNGLLGVPGDWSPPSRFVKMAIIKRFILTPPTAEKGVNLAQHLLNIFDIPYGVIQEQNGEYETTQWIVIKDLKNLILYYRTYDQMTLKGIAFQPKDLVDGGKTIIQAMN